jgi:hypothetical protein
VCAVALVALAGCTSRHPGGTVTVTVTPTRSSSAALPGSGAPTESAASSSTRPTASRMTTLPATCDALPTSAISNAIGGTAIKGAEAFVIGAAEKDIGRLTYLNCRYGVTGSGDAAEPKIEVGVSLYATPAAAAKRSTATIDDYTTHGATGSPVRVGTAAGTILTGGSGAGYDAPLLVLASGQRTVAVTITSAIATGAAATKDATAVAKLALDRTGG